LNGLPKFRVHIVPNKTIIRRSEIDESLRMKNELSSFQLEERVKIGSSRTKGRPDEISFWARFSCFFNRPM
jgi:hypothetical protein